MLASLPHLRACLGIAVISYACVGLADERRVTFETQVAPIFKAKCGKCHGGNQPKAELTLTSAAGVAAGSESGRVIDVAQPAHGMLFAAVHAGEMPPADEKPLTGSEKETILHWLREGALLPTSADTRITTERITPLMLLRCTACHGARKQEGGLDLRTKASMLAGGKSGPAAVPGNPAQSLLVKRIHAAEMPPRRLLVEASVKTMEPHEVALLEQWIAEGMPESTRRPVAHAANAVDQEFWSFQTPRRPPLPRTSSADVGTPVDAFVLRKLQQVDLGFAAAAAPHVLLRRATYDLTGLPPTPASVHRFAADTAPDAYERLVDRLLTSPHHGERSARQWLDVAGYADSEGAQNEDRVRPHMWRYRDYVIQSFCEDKPYARFLQEQLAGDELCDYEAATLINNRMYDNLVATGFLRTAPDRTFADITNFVPERLEVIADEMQIFGSAVLGLTIGCARCHAHKFDPISQSDYYQLTAIFKDAYDEHDWLKSQGPRTLNYVTTAERQSWEQNERRIDAQIAQRKRDQEAAGDAAAKKEYDEQIRTLESRRRPEPRIRALWSRGRPSPSFVYQRGNYLTPGREVAPNVPSVLQSDAVPFQMTPRQTKTRQTGRRLALAQWLTHPQHPLTSRVMVNRVWSHHFGQGIVKTLDNFGKAGARPSHPQLLDWLARELIHREWSVQALHRLIVTSRTYRQTSLSDHLRERLDPDNRWCSRMPLRRLDAEAVRDSLLVVAGRLNTRQFGRADAIRETGTGLVTAVSTHGAWRRSIYVLQRRTKTPTILESFDFPQMGPNCVQRGESIVAPQALHMMNDATVRTLAKAFAERLTADYQDETDRVEAMFVIAVGRAPTGEERAAALKSLVLLREAWQRAEVSTEQANEQAWTNACHGIINSAALLYMD